MFATSDDVSLLSSLQAAKTGLAGPNSLASLFAQLNQEIELISWPNEETKKEVLAQTNDLLAHFGKIDQMEIVEIQKQARPTFQALSGLIEKNVGLESKIGGLVAKIGQILHLI